ncbi:hypothetical protein [Sporolactobacillus nakayamae]|uniref:hypothetical protein n=1 Tax=Sporolactobacillus nakayamae TaxID=269670 RepID=UPI00116072AD|nr:hypothetical protein [Sporolactobacillus nakayamae]
MIACRRDPTDTGLLDEARGAHAASEQPKRRFRTIKTRTNDTWLEISDRPLFVRFFPQVKKVYCFALPVRR